MTDEHAPTLAKSARVGQPQSIRIGKGWASPSATGLQSHKSCVGSIVTRPCKERKDGAPSAPVVTPRRFLPLGALSAGALCPGHATEPRICVNNVSQRECSLSYYNQSGTADGLLGAVCSHGKDDSGDRRGGLHRLQLHPAVDAAGRDSGRQPRQADLRRQPAQSAPGFFRSAIFLPGRHLRSRPACADLFELTSRAPSCTSRPRAM